MSSADDTEYRRHGVDLRFFNLADQPRWLGSVMVRASDLVGFVSTGCKFDSQPCAAGLVGLTWMGRAKNLGM